MMPITLVTAKIVVATVGGERMTNYCGSSTVVIQAFMFDSEGERTKAVK